MLMWLWLCCVWGRISSLPVVSNFNLMDLSKKTTILAFTLSFIFIAGLNNINNGMRVCDQKPCYQCGQDFSTSSEPKAFTYYPKFCGGVDDGAELEVNRSQVFDNKFAVEVALGCIQICDNYGPPLTRKGCYEYQYAWCTCWATNRTKDTLGNWDRSNPDWKATLTLFTPPFHCINTGIIVVDSSACRGLETFLYYYIMTACIIFLTSWILLLLMAILLTCTSPCQESQDELFQQQALALLNSNNVIVGLRGTKRRKCRPTVIVFRGCSQ